MKNEFVKQITRDSNVYGQTIPLNTLLDRFGTILNGKHTVWWQHVDLDAQVVGIVHEGHGLTMTNRGYL